MRLEKMAKHAASLFQFNGTIMYDDFITGSVQSTRVRDLHKHQMTIP